MDTGASADELARWLAGAHESGYLAVLGSETLSDGTVIGPQRYCLASALDRERQGGSGHSAGRRSADCNAPAR